MPRPRTSGPEYQEVPPNAGSARGIRRRHIRARSSRDGGSSRLHGRWHLWCPWGSRSHHVAGAVQPSEPTKTLGPLRDFDPPSPKPRDIQWCHPLEPCRGLFNENPNTRITGMADAGYRHKARKRVISGRQIDERRTPSYGFGRSAVDGEIWRPRQQQRSACPKLNCCT
jgi:hypothetical protein